MRIRIHEDRPEAYIGVKILVASLLETTPGATIEVSATEFPAAYRDWLLARSGVVATERPDLRGRGWNAKPTVLLEQLQQGHPEVVWIDSDIVLAGDLRRVLSGSPATEVVVTEDHAWAAFSGGDTRTRLWGLSVGRSMPCAINSGLVRVTSHHEPLVAAWARLLDTEQYRSAQQRPFLQRPLHMVGDQDVLEAVLSSHRFKEVPVRILRRGVDVVTHTTAAGFGVRERLRSLRYGLPPIVHSVEPKPWSSRGWAERLVAETSPYTHVARRYRSAVTEFGTDGAAELESVLHRSTMACCMEVLSGSHAALVGLPLAAVATIRWWLKRGLLRRHDWPTPESHLDASLEVDGEEALARLSSEGGISG